jgi:hypothetical protein
VPHRADDVDGTEVRVLEVAHDAGVADLLVVEHGARWLHGEAGDLVGPARLQPLVGRLGAEQLGQARAEHLEVVVGEQRRRLHCGVHAADVVGDAEQLHRPGERAGRPGVDLHHPPVGTDVAPQQHAQVAHVERPGAGLAGDERQPPLVRPVHAHLGEHAVGHADVDLVAFPGHDAGSQRGEDADHGDERRPVLDRRVAGEDRAVALAARLGHHAVARRREGRIPTGVDGAVAEVGERPDPAVNDVGVHRPHGVGTESHRVEEPGTHRLDDHIGIGGQPPGDGAIPVVVQVEHDARLAPVPCPAGLVEARRRPGRGDGHHLGTVVGEHHRRHRTGHPAREIEDADAVERAGHGRLPSTWITGATLAHLPRRRTNVTGAPVRP